MVHWTVLRTIEGFSPDEQGDWVAHLACLHRQHVRHRPPFRDRPWVLTGQGRAEHLGTPLDCPLCDRAELPAGLEVVRTAGPFDATTLPAGLRRSHRVADRTWGRLRVLKGAVGFTHGDRSTGRRPPRRRRRAGHPARRGPRRLRRRALPSRRRVPDHPGLIERCVSLGPPRGHHGGVRRRALPAVLAVLALATLGLGACTPPPLRVETALGGLDHPWDLGFTPDGTLLLTERPGPVSAVVGGQKRVLADPPDVVAASEAGMMGLAIDPKFAENRLLYTCFASTLGGPSNDVRLVRWEVSADYTTLFNRLDIITGLPVNTVGQLGRHSGCRPRFGPDGRLWVGTGDAAVGSVPQDPHSLGGKVLRVNRRGQGVAGNPGRRPRSPHLELRPPQRAGPRLPARHRPAVFSVEHGPDRDDEVNRPEAGRNYGWDPVPGYNEAVPMTDLAKFPARRAGGVELGSAAHRAVRGHLPGRGPVGGVGRRPGRHRPAGRSTCGS